MEDRILLSRAEAVSLFSWLLKDLGWVLYVAPLAFPAALVALCAEVHMVVTNWAGSSAGARTHDVAQALWLSGNFAWMVADFGFGPADKPGNSFPWHRGPLAMRDEQAYGRGLLLCQALLVAGLLALLALYAAFATGAARVDGGGGAAAAAAEAGGIAENPQDDAPAARAATAVVARRQQREDLVFGIFAPEIYVRLFMGPWIAKDLFWTMEMGAPCLIAALAALFFAGDCARRFGGAGFRAELLWFCGNSVWAFTEMVLEDRSHGPRLLAAAVLLAGAACAAEGVARGALVRPSAEEQEERAGERMLLLPVGRRTEQG